VADRQPTCFDDLSVGQELPPYHYDLTPSLVRRYGEVVGAEPPVYPLVPESGGSAPVAPPLLLDTLHAMKALLGFPEGVVHAREEVEQRASAREGDRVTVLLSVADKYLKNDKRFVVFEQRATNQHGATLIVARKTMVWPC
jgi:hypothetical protein